VVRLVTMMCRRVTPYRMKAYLVRVALAVLLFALLLPVSVQAQNLVQVDRMQINIWPEYDRRSILAIYRLTLAQTTSLPAEMTISIPAAAQVPFNLAFEDVDGLLYNLEHSLRQNGPWVDVRFTTPAPVVQLEFYDPNYERDGDQRTYEYNWPGNFPVRSLSVLVQQPVNATSMTIRPDIGRGRQGPDGMVLYTAVIGEVEAGRTFSYRIEYEKPDDELVTPPMTVRPVEPITAQTAGRTTMMEVIPWILGSLGVLLIAVGAYWYWRAGRDIPEPTRRRHAPAREKDESEEITEEIYCHQCGKRAAPGDAFCRTCGTKLQID
jgi:hypothetical protein